MAIGAGGLLARVWTPARVVLIKSIPHSCDHRKDYACQQQQGGENSQAVGSAGSMALAIVNDRATHHL
jgi:hypothetical protein